MNRPTDPMWYVRKGNRVQGPFYVYEMHRFIELGRINVKFDYVSIDGCAFEPVSQVPELIPDSILDTVGTWTPDPEWEPK